MNYRHHFHAGNFADIVKHAVLLAVLEELKKDASPLAVLDTHAGAGLYDLTGGEAKKSGEAERGIARLMKDPDAPEALRPLIGAVKRLNPDGNLRFYPGSPLLAVKALRKGDRYKGHELRPDDYLALSALLKRETGPVEAVADRHDGYAALDRPERMRRLILIDPPFERGDEYAQILANLPKALAQPGTTAAIWLPIKDLETLDAFVSGLEAMGVPLIMAEARLTDLTKPLSAICGWTAQRLGEAGAKARVEFLPNS